MQPRAAICGRLRRRALLACALPALLLHTATLAAQVQEQGRPAVMLSDPGAQALVRRAVQKELKASAESRYMYRLRRETPNGSTTRQMIETRDGIVARTIAHDDKPLTPDQRAKDEARLQRLLEDPEEQRRRHEEQRHYEERVRNLVGVLPDAFLYQLENTEAGRHGTLYRLAFRPNPEFDPPNRETQIYRGMVGKMWLHAEEERLVRIEAQLADKVNFGWGILGHLDRGGTLRIEQDKIGPLRWEMTRLELNLTGRILLFKRLRVQQVQTASHFRPVPNDLTLAQGIALLREQSDIVAETPPSAEGAPQPAASPTAAAQQLQ